VKQYEDLIVWRLSVQVRDEIFRLTQSGEASKDFKFRDQIRESSRSAPRNIAEGFGRFAPKPPAGELELPRGS
jgi:four helix bundle protein